MKICRRSFIRRCGLSAAVLAPGIVGLRPLHATEAWELPASTGRGGVPPYPTVKKRIPFTLNGRSGSVTVFYGRSEDPESAGFGIIPGINFDIALCRGYPAMRAVIGTYNGTGYRTFCGWVQVITGSYYDSYDPARAPVKTVVSADMAPSMEGLGSPFAAFGNLPQLFDAPCKNLYGHARLRWVADTFLTTVPIRSRDEEVARLLGFRWGYIEYDKPKQRPVKALPLEVTGAKSWNRLLPFLRKQFPKWRFAKTS